VSACGQHGADHVDDYVKEDQRGEPGKERPNFSASPERDETFLALTGGGRVKNSPIRFLKCHSLSRIREEMEGETRDWRFSGEENLF
jgi:hypothetical protein